MRVDSRSDPKLPVGAVVTTVVALLAASAGLQVLRDALPGQDERSRGDVLYVSDGAVMKRLVLAYGAVAADVYWIRALQYYGGGRRSTVPDKTYDLLYPLLDMVTTLDPKFSIAYRFGSIFLAEAHPDGPGRPDLAVALLQKGIEAQPEKWQYLQDIGFVHYWWLHDYEAAGAWFEKASETEGAPWWLRSLAATTLAQGGERGASRMLWERILEEADHEWLRGEATRRLMQLTALDDIDQLTAALQGFTLRHGFPPRSWQELVARGILPGPPVDPAGVPYLLEPRSGQVTVAPTSPMFPLPAEPPPTVPIT